MDIKNNLPPEFPSLPAQEQAAFLSEVHGAIQSLVSQDRSLRSVVKDTFRNGLTRESGIKVAGILHAKARAVLPAAIRRIMKEHGEVFKQARPTRPAASKANSQPAPTPAKPTPSSLAEARARGMNLKQILESVTSEDEKADADNVLGLEEARQMSDRDILATPRRADLSKLPSKRNASLEKSEARNMSFREILDDERPIAAGE